MTIKSLIFGFCIQTSNLMVYQMTVLLIISIILRKISYFLTFWPLLGFCQNQNKILFLWQLKSVFWNIQSFNNLSLGVLLETPFHWRPLWTYRWRPPFIHWRPSDFIEDPISHKKKKYDGLQAGTFKEWIGNDEVVKSFIKWNMSDCKIAVFSWSLDDLKS